jgi:acetone carboxylase gamma subunit
MERIRFTEYLDMDLGDENWYCHICGHKIGTARGNYKKGCLVYERNPKEIHDPIIPKAPYNFSPKEEWVSILEFYCPGCGTQVETEYLPPGHPITHDIAVDVDSLKKAVAEKIAHIENGKLRR